MVRGAKHEQRLKPESEFHFEWLGQPGRAECKRIIFRLGISVILLYTPFSYPANSRQPT